MKYKNITIYYDKDDNFEKAVIETKYNEFEIDNEEKFDALLAEYAEQNGVTVEELIEDEDFIKVVQDKPKKKIETEKTFELTDEELDAIFGDSSNDDEKKPKKKSWVKRLIAYAAVVAVLGTGSYHLYKHRDKVKAKLEGLFHSDKKAEFVINDSSNNYTYSSSNNTNTSGITTSDNDNKYDEVMVNVMQREEKNNKVIQQLAANGMVVELSNDEIFETLNDHTRIANSSIFEVSQYINDRGLTGKPYYYDFSKLFVPGSADYYAVMMFSNERNDIINEVFQNNNKEEAKELIKSFYNSYTYFVMSKGTQVFIYDNQRYELKFDDLSDMAKATILEIGSAMFTIDLDYSYNDGNYRFDKEEILNDSVAMLEGELIPRLINKGYRK